MLSGKPCISTSGTPVPAVISAYSWYGPRVAVNVRLLSSITPSPAPTSEHAGRLVAVDVRSVGRCQRAGGLPSLLGLLDRYRGVVGVVEQVAGVVAGLDLDQSVPGRTRLGLTDAEGLRR